MLSRQDPASRSRTLVLFIMNIGTTATDIHNPCMPLQIGFSFSTATGCEAN